MWVHPTNVFAGAAIAVACLARWRRQRMTKPECRMTKDRRIRHSSFVIRHSLRHSSLVIGHFSLGVPGAGRLALGRVAFGADRRNGPAIFGGLANVTNLYPRLFTGGTIYRYIAGSRSWFEWPLPADFDGWGLDVGLFWSVCSARRGCSCVPAACGFATTPTAACGFAVTASCWPHGR